MESSSLYTTILGELAFLFAVVSLILGLLVKKMRAAAKDMTRELASLRVEAECRDSDASILAFIQRQLQLTKERFSLGRGDGSVKPEVGVVAFDCWRLRENYLSAEKSALNEIENSSDYWSVLEVALMAILAKFGDSAAWKSEASNWKNKVDLLRDRIHALKGYEARCKNAEDELVGARLKVEKLERLGTVGQVSRGNIEKIFELNKRLAVQSYGAIVISQSDGFNIASSADNISFDQSDFVNEKISRQRQTILELKEKLRSYQLELERATLKSGDCSKENSLAERIAELEEELSLSEVSAETLSRDIEQLKRLAFEQDGHVVRARLGESNSDELEFWRRGNKSGNEDGKGFGIIQVHDAQPKETAAGDDAEREKVRAAYIRAVKGLDDLRDVTQRQRHVILELERELKSLRNQEVFPDGLDQEEHENSIKRLEQLYRESEICVQVLESEVDSLHDRLGSMAEDLSQSEQEYFSDINGCEAVDLKGSTDDERILALNQELEKMSELLDSSMLAYSDQSCVTRFAAICFRCQDIAQLTKELMLALKQLGLIAATQIRSELGGVDSVDVGKFTPQDKLKLTTTCFSGSEIKPEKGGFIVCSPNLTIYVKGASEGRDKSSKEHLDATLISLVSIASFAVEKIEHAIVRERQRKSLNNIISDVKKSISNVGVQYQYQRDEANKIVNRLLKELHVNLGSVDLTPTQKSVFDEMRSDCQERLALLFASGLSADESMQKMIDKITNRKIG